MYLGQYNLFLLLSLSSTIIVLFPYTLTKSWKTKKNKKGKQKNLNLTNKSINNIQKNQTTFVFLQLNFILLYN